MKERTWLRDLRIAATCSAHGLTQAERLTLIDEVERLQALEAAMAETCKTCGHPVGNHHGPKYLCASGQTRFEPRQETDEAELGAWPAEYERARKLLIQERDAAIARAEKAEIAANITLGWADATEKAEARVSELESRIHEKQVAYTEVYEKWKDAERRATGADVRSSKKKK